MKILLIEPFYSGSHKKWVDGFIQHSTHEVDKLTLPGRHWKWRMHGAAVTLAHRFLALNETYDIILASDFLDLAVFKGLLGGRLDHVKVGVYFHENQLTYPWSPEDQDVHLRRDRHYAFINFTSALAADFCWFNSDYHRHSFMASLPNYLEDFPDFKNLERVKEIDDKSETKYLGLDLPQGLSRVSQVERLTLLWNHRWEYDKNPEEFFHLCFRLKEKGVDFKLIVCGEVSSKHPKIFSVAKLHLEDHILHWGYAETKQEYLSLLNKANVLIVTSNQDFFGGSVVEAMHHGCRPFLPNRLAYPEHIPESGKSLLIYNDLAVVENALVENKWRLPDEEWLDLIEHLSRYHWENIIQEYENALGRLVKTS